MQKDVAARAHVSEATVSIWNRNEDWRKRVSEILRSRNEPLVELLQRALLARGMQGSVKHAELAMRVAGRLDVLPDGGVVGSAGGQAQANTIINFVGLPKPPTPQEAEARRPPVGSNVITPAPALAPMPVRPPVGR